MSRFWNNCSSDCDQRATVPCRGRVLQLQLLGVAAVLSFIMSVKHTEALRAQRTATKNGAELTENTEISCRTRNNTNETLGLEDKLQSFLKLQRFLVTKNT